MDIVLTHATALRLIRGRRFPTGHAGACPSGLPDKMPTPANAAELKRLLPELAQVEGPISVLVAKKTALHASDVFAPHVWSGPVPKGALVQVAPGVRCATPAMLAVLMAPRLSDLELQMLLAELMGLFAPSDDYEMGLFQRRDPLITPAELSRFLDAMGTARGTVRVRRALKRAPVAAASPLEAKLYLRATYPFSQGGYRMGEVVLNDPVEVRRLTCRCDALQRRKPDLMFRHGDACACLDYMGAWHDSAAGVRRDTERRNELLAAGFKPYEIFKDEYDDLDYMDSLMSQIRDELGMPRSKSGRERKLERWRARKRLWKQLEKIDLLAWETRVDLR